MHANQEKTPARQQPTPLQAKATPNNDASLSPPAFQLKAAPAQMQTDGDSGDGNDAALFQAKTIVGLNVRSGPSTSFDPPLETLAAGTPLTVYETKDGWYRVGGGRWVSGSSRFVERVQEEEQEEQQETPEKEKSPTEKMLEAAKSYAAGDIDMIGLAKAMIPFAGSHGAHVQAVMNKLPENHRDNLAYAMASNVDDATLATFDKGLLSRMHTELSGWLNTTNWAANWAMAERVAKAKGAAGKSVAPKEEAGSEPDSEFARLWEKDRLTTEEIATVRVHIDQMEDGAQKEQYYVDLQEKVEYVNQRNVGAYAGEDYWGGSCNLASLAMCMSYLGLSVPSKYQEMDGFPSSNVVEQLEFIRRTEELGARTTMGGWGGVGEAVGAKKTDLVFQEIKDRQWFETTVLDHIKAGHAVMCSIHGHIVRIQGMNDSGVIVDDPYGESKLEAGTERSWEKINDTDVEERQGGKWAEWRLGHGNVGEDHDWPWADVEASSFNWISAWEKA